MEMTLAEFLPIVLYILGSILLVILIILGIKLIKTMDKIEDVVDDINKKVKSLDGFFSVIDFTTDKLAMLSDRVVETTAAFIKKLFKRKESVSEDE